MLRTGSTTSSTSSARRSPNTISLTDQFYHELIAPPPPPKDNMAPSHVDTVSSGKNLRSQKIIPVPVSPIDREDDIPEEEEMPTQSSRAQPARQPPASRKASITKESRSRSQSHSQAVISPSASGRNTPQYGTPNKENEGYPNRSSSRRQTNASSNGPPAASTLVTSQSASNLSVMSNTNLQTERRPIAVRSSSAVSSNPSHNVSTTLVNTMSNVKTPSSDGPPQPASSTSAPAVAVPRSITPPPKKTLGIYTAFPPLRKAPTSPTDDVPPAPASGMYWSPAPSSGSPHTALRAHTCTLLGSSIYIFGGCDAGTCFNTLYIYDCESFHWSAPRCFGVLKPGVNPSMRGKGHKDEDMEMPLPLRAMTCTAVGKKLVVFGGGDGPKYTNDVWVLDTVNHRWSKPTVVGSTVPSKRRAHTACLYRNGIYIFGGGDGVRALNDVWRLDVSELNQGKVSWKLISSPSAPSDSASLDSQRRHERPIAPKPKPRGYHTANIVGSKLIVFGGSDGDACFSDVWLFDILTNFWTCVNTITNTSPSPQSVIKPNPKGDKGGGIVHPRLSHTATLVGSYLFVVGGHDGVEYTNEVLCLNLVTMTWDVRRVYGKSPMGRGYHGTVLYDGRLYVIGGFDGNVVFGGGIDKEHGVGEREKDGVWILELGGCAYYSQISCFSIEV